MPPGDQALDAHDQQNGIAACCKAGNQGDEVHQYQLPPDRLHQSSIPEDAYPWGNEEKGHITQQKVGTLTQMLLLEDPGGEQDEHKDHADDAAGKGEGQQA